MWRSLRTRSPLLWLPMTWESTSDTTPEGRGEGWRVERLIEGVMRNDRGREVGENTMYSTVLYNCTCVIYMYTFCTMCIYVYKCTQFIGSLKIRYNWYLMLYVVLCCRNIDTLGAKEMVMGMVNHGNSEVRMQALISIQKMMVQKLVRPDEPIINHTMS